MANSFLCCEIFYDGIQFAMIDVLSKSLDTSPLFSGSPMSSSSTSLACPQAINNSAAHWPNLGLGNLCAILCYDRYPLLRDSPEKLLPWHQLPDPNTHPFPCYRHLVSIMAFHFWYRHLFSWFNTKLTVQGVNGLEHQCTLPCRYV